MNEPSSSKQTVSKSTAKTQVLRPEIIQTSPQNDSSQMPEGMQAENLINLPNQAATSALRRAAVQKLQQSHGNQAVQRLMDEDDKDKQDASPTIALKIKNSLGQGKPLDQDVQSQLEQHLQSDLSSVRVHTDPDAHRMAKELHAKAFTTGQDIYFRSGTYAPESPEGARLLAHEAAHTIQQKRGPVSGTLTEDGLLLSQPGDAFEQQADQIANQWIDSSRAMPAPKGLVQRETESASAKALEEAADEAQLIDAVKIEQKMAGIDNVDDINQAKSLLNQVIAATATLDPHMGEKGWGGYLTNQHKVDNQNAAQNLELYLTYAGEESRTSGDFKTRYTMVKTRFSRLDAMANEWMAMYDTDMRTPEDFIKTETGMDAQGAGKQAKELTNRSKDEPTEAVEARAARDRIKDLRNAAGTQMTLLNSFDDQARDANLRVIGAANRIESAAQASKAKPEEPDSPQVAEVKKKMADVKAKMSAGVSVAKMIPGAGKYVEGVESAASATSTAAEATGLDIDLTKVPDMILTDIYRTDLENALSAQNTARAAAATAGSIANTADLEAALGAKVSAAQSRKEIADQLNTTLTSIREAINTLGQMLDETYKTKKGGGQVGGGYELIAKFLAEADTCMYEADMALHSGKLQKDSATQTEGKRKITLEEKNSQYHRVDPVADRFEIITKHIAIISTGEGSSGGEGGMSEMVEKMIAEIEAGKKIVEAYKTKFNQALGL